MPVVAVDVDRAALFNELIHLDPANLDRAGQIEWQLRAKLRGQPADRDWQISLVQALSQQGKAEEALVFADQVWAGRATLSQQLLKTFQQQLISLGLYERALDLMPALSALGAFSDNQEHARRVQLSWLVGDFETFKNLVIGERDQSMTLFAEEGRQFCHRVDSLGLASHLPDHQRIVRSIIGNRQVQAALKILRELDDDDSWPELSQVIYVAGTYAERREIEDRVYEGLSGLYASVGQGDAPFWDLMMPVVLDVTSRPPYAIY